MEKIKSINAKRKGITLIALVITIIVLLILAGITINLTIGQDGILRRAEEAGKNYTEAAEYERNQLAELLNETDKIIGNVTGGSNTAEPLYTMVEEVPVPKGFTHTEGTKDTGFVIKNDKDGNEFVWVPIDDTTTYSYERVAFSKSGWTYTQTKGDYDATSQSYKIIRADQTGYYYTETMPTIVGNRTELDSVTEYKGFYIGRYEVGVTGYDSTVLTSNSSNSTNWTGYSNGTAVVQRGYQVWNYITRDKAKEIAEGMYTDLNSVTSRLCSSYAWDTALKFIEITYAEYPTNSTVGNYSDKSETLGKPAKTGQTTAINNIYDMGGNVWEWTTEAYSNESYPCTYRGGAYDNSSSNAPAAYRNFRHANEAIYTIGFRCTLYL